MVEQHIIHPAEGLLRRYDRVVGVSGSNSKLEAKKTENSDTPSRWGLRRVLLGGKKKV